MSKRHYQQHNFNKVKPKQKGSSEGFMKTPWIHTKVFHARTNQHNVPETIPETTPTTSDTWDETMRQAFRLCVKRVRMCKCTTQKSSRNRRQEEHRRWLEERLQIDDDWRDEFAQSIASLSYFDASQDERSSIAKSMSFFDTQEDYWSDEEDISNDKFFKSDSKKGGMAEFPIHDGKSINKNAVLHRPSSILSIIDPSEIPEDSRGYPGLLTSDEYDAIMEFKYQLDQQKDPMYWDMVRHFSEVEPEAFSLCRFCRARKFDVSEVMKMMSSHVDEWRYARENNFFPDVEKDTGICMSVMFTQYPFLYMGNSKQGFPVCYFNAGKVSIDGMLCIATMKNIQMMQWHISTFTTKEQYLRWKERDPDSFVPRLEQITVINLEGMSKSFFSKKNLSSLDTLNKVLNAFPEMLYRCIVINAPSFFAWAWRLIKHMLDEKTASRVVIFSDKTKAEKYLLDLIDEEELPSDYGGKNECTADIIRRMGNGREHVTRQFTQLLDFAYAKATTTARLYGGSRELEYNFELVKSEMVTITLYTRCSECIVFTLVREQDGQIVKSMELVNPKILARRIQDTGSDSDRTIPSEEEDDDDPQPYETKFITDFRLSGKYSLKGETVNGKSSSSSQVLLIGDIYQNM